MKRQAIVGLALVTALATPLVGCGTSSSSSSATTPAAASSSSESSDFDANSFYVGQWRGAVALTGQTVYGTATGSENMLDVYFEEDGTCSVVPLEAHNDLLTDEGTWEGTETEVVLHLSSGDITLTVESKSTLSGTAADFDIADFETIEFEFYG